MKKEKRSLCPIACSLDVLGDKWTLIIVRDLILGRRYFKDFLASPESISTNILTDRLNRLLEEDIAVICPDPATNGRNTYKLSKKGESLIPVLEIIRDWGLENIKGTSLEMDAYT